LTLGLLVFPSKLATVAIPSIVLVFVLMFIARPVSVMLSLIPFKMTLGKKIMMSWVGLRGAVPIILATFPLLAGISQADTIFNVVFFVILASVLIQGTTVPIVSRLLNVDAPFSNKKRYPIEFEKAAGIDAELNDVIVPYNSQAAGKKIMDLNTPQECLIMLVSRGDKFIIPAGPTVIEGGDVLLVLSNEKDLLNLRNTLSVLKEELK